jgi:hypothetical protein
VNKIIALLFVLTFAVAGHAQQELLTNADVAEMAAAGLSDDVLITKIQASKNRFDISSRGLIELKKSGVPDSVITLMLAKQSAEIPAEKLPLPVPVVKEPSAVSEKKAVAAATTIEFSKTSLQPSLSALEKELLKRADWRALDLTIVRYRNTADLSVEIHFVHGSILSHRYTFRVFDRRSGTVVAAGETTSWGSLAENLARHITKGLRRI